MALQDLLKEDLNNHKIVVNKLYAHVQQNGVLKTDFLFEMDLMLKMVKNTKRLDQQSLSKMIKVRRLLVWLPEGEGRW